MGDERQVDPEIVPSHAVTISESLTAPATTSSSSTSGVERVGGGGGGGGRNIILFDGVCNVCDTFVQFIYPRDSKKLFHFQALQSQKGREICSSYGIPLDLSTIVLIKEGENKFYVKSEAVFLILCELDMPWSSLYYFIFVPRPLRDFGYSTFASFRYLMFGKKDSCSFRPGLKDRFIDWRSPIIEQENENIKDV